MYWSRSIEFKVIQIWATFCGFKARFQKKLLLKSSKNDLVTKHQKLKAETYMQTWKTTVKFTFQVHLDLKQLLDTRSG